MLRCALQGAMTVGWFIAARFIDRIGKGLRGKPRDALAADLSPLRCIDLVVTNTDAGIVVS